MTETTMINTLRIAAAVLPLLYGSSSAVAAVPDGLPADDMAIVEPVVMTGSENNIREFLGLPLLDDHAGATGEVQPMPKPHGTSRRHRTHDRQSD
jgi:hypothetical protein